MTLNFVSGTGTYIEYSTDESKARCISDLSAEVSWIWIVPVARKKQAALAVAAGCLVNLFNKATQETKEIPYTINHDRAGY